MDDLAAFAPVVTQVDYKGRSVSDIENGMKNAAAEFDKMSGIVKDYFDSEWGDHQVLKEANQNSLITEEKHAYQTSALENSGLLDGISIKSSQDKKPFNSALTRDLSLAYGQFGMSETLLRSGDVYNAGFRLDQAEAYLKSFKTNFLKSNYAQSLKSRSEAS